MFDVTTNGDFSSTEMELKAETQEGKKMFESLWGAGALSVKVPKSKGNDLITYLKRKGLKVG